MFAGPNGSGKSTIKEGLPLAWLGIYINPDEIEKAIRAQGFLDVTEFQIQTSAVEILGFFKNSDFLIHAKLLPQAQKLTFLDNKIHFTGVKVNSYFASVLSDFIRNKLLEAKISFAFETVMSSEDKVFSCKRHNKAVFAPTCIMWQPMTR